MIKIKMTGLTLLPPMRRTIHNNLSQLANATKRPSCKCCLAARHIGGSHIILFRVCGFLSVFQTIGPNLSYGVFRTYISESIFPGCIPAFRLLRHAVDLKVDPEGELTA